MNKPSILGKNISILYIQPSKKNTNESKQLNNTLNGFTLKKNGRTHKLILRIMKNIVLKKKCRQFKWIKKKYLFQC